MVSFRELAATVATVGAAKEAVYGTAFEPLSHSGVVEGLNQWFLCLLLVEHEDQPPLTLVLRLFL